MAWRRIAAAWVFCVTLVAGCRTTQPDLKPAETRQEFNAPPMEARYNQGGYPKSVFQLEDPAKRNNLDAQSMTSPRGMGAGPGMR